MHARAKSSRVRKRRRDTWEESHLVFQESAGLAIESEIPRDAKGCERQVQAWYPKREYRTSFDCALPYRRHPSRIACLANTK